MSEEEEAERQPLLVGPDSGNTSSGSNINSSSCSNNSSISGSYSVWGTFLIFFFPALGGLLFGYDIGATSAVLTQLKTKTYSGVEWYHLVSSSSVLQGTITSLGMFGAMLGSITCFAVADQLGRRRTLILASVLFFVGALTECIAGASSSWSAGAGVTLLLLGRLIYGYACGFAMHGAPAYIGEMAPHEIRGLLVSLKEAFIVTGMVLGYAIGYAYSSTVAGWRSVYGWSSVLAVVMFGGMFWVVPSSARWLAMKGRVNEARHSLLFVRPLLLDQDQEMENLREIAARVAENDPATDTLADDWVRFTTPAILPAMVAGIGLVVFQQVSGQPSVLYYADSLFEDVGMSRIASIAISIFKLIATLVSTFNVDKYGRKVLLYIGCSLMLVALLVLGVSFLFDYTSAEECYSHLSSASCAPTSACTWDSSCEADCLASGMGLDVCLCCGPVGVTTQKVIILLALFVYIGGYQVGFGPISWLLISEIFPLEVRGKAVSVAVVTNFFWNTVMTFVFPVEIEYMGTSATFFLYATVLIAALWFIYHRVPETKGLTLEEIEARFLLLAQSQAQPGAAVSENATKTRRSREEYQEISDPVSVETQEKHDDSIL